MIEGWPILAATRVFTPDSLELELHILTAYSDEILHFWRADCAAVQSVQFPALAHIERVCTGPQDRISPTSGKGRQPTQAHKVVVGMRQA